MKLQNLQVGQSYLVKDYLTQDDIRKHLAHLGLKVGEEIRIISKTKTNAIFQVKASRLALDREIIESLVLIEKSATEIINLSEAPIGSSAKVMDIYATGPLRRRLMDMGLTKNTQLFLKKVAPLGDPIEITLRGYELTLRKSEAQMIGVQITSEVRK
ncbi:FeoA family protein [Streptococcus suis]|uniref:Fe2+ transporter protein A n=1 Tax=Streptococcus suis TaxID=1307 RepID=A0AB33U9P0_STRSU|nr:ferrous iron transport protein A [Streptococcus suis]MCQ9224144.1 ferrous iron transport protein A [Streptococcus suis]MCQ9230865.1 ferrous iron transport protein A [Streptococcus suis]NQH31650.1 ferrous iron transport protein A [Streptococcus suis]NQH53023.1 ferrous iron transport protein A [Streptococcus suis]NQP48788.1 ferrous iron transport protein A [Streptococcus suis]